MIGEREALSLLTPAPTSRGFYFLARERGAWSKIVFVLRKLVPSPEFMRLRYPLAGKGPVGLLVAYLYRPFWLVRWALPGLRSWQQARRLARASRGDVRTDREALRSSEHMRPRQDEQQEERRALGILVRRERASRSSQTEAAHPSP